MTTPSSRGARRLLAQIQEFRVAFSLFFPVGAKMDGRGDITTEMIGGVQEFLGGWCGECGYSRTCSCIDVLSYTAEELMLSVDDDGSGTVSFCEFCQLMTSPCDEWKGLKNQVRR